MILKNNKASAELKKILLGENVDPLEIANECYGYFEACKYELAEPIAISSINKLEEAIHKLKGDSLLSKIKVVNFDRKKVFSEVQKEIAAARDLAKDYLNAIQDILFLGIEDPTKSERYQKALRMRRRLNAKFWVWTCSTILCTGYLAVHAYSPLREYDNPTHKIAETIQTQIEVMNDTYNAMKVTAILSG